MGRRRSPLLRVPAIAALIALSLWLGYLVLGNAALASGWLEARVSGHPDQRLLELGSAWTLWPGRVQVRHFRLRHAADELELEIRMPRATVDVELAALARQELVVKRIRADGVVVRARRLLADPRAQWTRAQALARIDGLSAIPSAPDRDCGPAEPQRRASGRQWQLEIAGIDLRIAELWIEEFRYVGPGRIRGAFRFAPSRELELRDTTLELGPGQLGFGELGLIASRLEASVRGHVETLDLSDDARLGWRALRQLTLRGALSARIADLGFARAYFPRADLELGAGGGVLELLLGVDRGRMTPESRAEYRAERVALEVDDLSARGDLQLALDVIARAHKPRGRIRLAAQRIEIGTGACERPATLRGLELELLASSVDLSKKWRTQGGALKLSALSVPDLTLLNSVKNGGDWKLLGGALQASLEAVLDRRGRVNGQLALQADRARLSVGELGLSASGSLRTGLYQPSLRAPRGELRDASCELERVSFSTDRGSSGAASLSARSARIDYRAFSPQELDIQFASAFDSAEGLLRARDLAESGSPRIARLVAALVQPRVAGSVRYDARKWSVEIDRVRDGAAAGRHDSGISNGSAR